MNKKLKMLLVMSIITVSLMTITYAEADETKTFSVEAGTGLDFSLPDNAYGIIAEQEFDFDNDGINEKLSIQLVKGSADEYDVVDDELYAIIYEKINGVYNEKDRCILLDRVETQSGSCTYKANISYKNINGLYAIAAEDYTIGQMATGQRWEFKAVYYNGNKFVDIIKTSNGGSSWEDYEIQSQLSELHRANFNVDNILIFDYDGTSDFIMNQLNGNRICEIETTYPNLDKSNRNWYSDLYSIFIGKSSKKANLNVTFSDYTTIVEKPVKVMLDNSELTFDQPPIIKGGRTLVPLRAIFEAIGYSVDWNQNTQTATAVLAGNKITVQLNNKTIYYTVNGVSSTYICDVEPQIVSDRILVPVRAIAESAGCDVAWDGDSRTVYINMDIIYETKTVSVEASTLDEWNEKIDSIERGLIGVSNLTKLDANGNEIFNGKIIIDREIISYNKIGVKVPNVMGPYTGKEKEHKTVYFNVPSEIKYVLHKHKTQNKATVSSIGKLMAGLVEQKWVLTQTCNCGYENVVEWSIPDFTPLSTDKLKNEYTVETTTSLYID